MGLRIKLRLKLTDGRTEKIAFQLARGERLPVIPGVEAFSAWSESAASEPIAFLSHDPEEGIVLEGASAQPLLALRGMVRARFTLRAGDTWESPYGAVEFIELPRMETEDPDAKTRWIGALPPEAAVSARAREAQAEADAVWPIEEPKDPAHEGRRLAFHFTISLVLLASSAELSQLVALGFEHEVSPLPTPFAALFANTLAIVFAFALARFRGRLRVEKGSFLEYYRFFAWVGVACVPWASSFAFPRWVEVLTSLLLAATGAAFFFVRFRPSAHRAFYASVAGAWLVAFTVGSLILPRAMEQPFDPRGRAERDLASAPEYLPGEPLPAPVVPGLPASEDVHAQFFASIRSGDLDTVKRLAEGRLMDPEFSLEDGSTPLIVAVKSLQPEIAKYLLSRRASPNAQDFDGNTALGWAVMKSDAALVEMLLKRRGDPKIRRGDGLSVREIAERIGDTSVIETLDRFSAGSE